MRKCSKPAWIRLVNAGSEGHVNLFLREQRVRSLTQLTTALVIAAVCTGCSHFVVRDDDNAAEVTGKVFSRVIFGVLSIGWSEVGMSLEVRELEERLFLEGYSERLSELVAEKKVTPVQAKWLYRHEAKYLADVAADRRDRVARAAAAASNQMQMNRPRSCTSNVVGNSVYTQCY